jgi:divalent metal cation (Fe/Co/Zn/Cd) transporter
MSEPIRRSLLVAVVVLGVVLVAIGVFVAWEAVLHNNITARRFRNPWPGYLLVAAGLVVSGWATLALRRRPR